MGEVGGREGGRDEGRGGTVLSSAITVFISYSWEEGREGGMKGGGNGFK